MFALQGLRSSVSTRLPSHQYSTVSMYLGCVCCWFSPLLLEVFSLGTSVFPSAQKPTLPNSNWIQKAQTRQHKLYRTLKCFVVKHITDYSNDKSEYAIKLIWNLSFFPQNNTLCFNSVYNRKHHSGYNINSSSLRSSKTVSYSIITFVN